MKRLEHRFLVEIRLGFDQCVIQQLEQRSLAVCKRIVERLFNNVIGVPFIAVDVSDRMAGRASNTSLCGLIKRDVKTRVLKFSREKWHRIVTARAPPKRFLVSVATRKRVARLVDGRQICGIVKGTEPMGTMKPTVKSIRMALHTVLVV